MSKDEKSIEQMRKDKCRELYEADLHDEIYGTSYGSWAIRVPGGWIYTMARGTSVFVPFNSEFQKRNRS